MSKSRPIICGQCGRHAMDLFRKGERMVCVLCKYGEPMRFGQGTDGPVSLTLCAPTLFSSRQQPPTLDQPERLAWRRK